MKTGAKVLRGILFWAGVLISVACARGQGAEAPVVSVVTDEKPGLAAQHGLEKILAALKEKGIAVETAPTVDGARGEILIVAGLAHGGGQAATLLKSGQPPLPEGSEALAIRPSNYRGKSLWMICGSDDRGLMYGELDVADRIAWSTDKANPLSELREANEKPELSNRTMVIFTMNRAYWESRFYDEKYWARYLDLMARSRFNQLLVTFGYENGGFLAPCYPYFFDVAGFPDVKMVGITPEQQAKNLKALNRLIEMAHERGIQFEVGIWDHIYRGGVQAGGVPGAEEAARRPTPGLVWGVTGQNLMPYTKSALAEFIRNVPGLDGIQFRMHDESGLRPGEQVGFWRDVFTMLKEKAPNLSLDLRAKGLPDEVINAGLEVGLKLKISTKYWMEQLGLPFHPTHINTQDQPNRRHSYADLLHYPKKYQIHWQVFNGATTRVLLWGDPEFTRRFAESNHLYDGDGFEIDEPLATKMEGQPHDMKPFELLTPTHRYYDYEFERYWHYFQVYGRMGYNPDTPAEVWDKEFETHFGKNAAPYVEKGLHLASWVLPRIVASDFPYNEFAMTYGWPEKERLGDLPAFARAQGSDIQLFENFDEEAQLLMGGGETPKVRPPETSRWFTDTAAAIEAQVAQAEKNIGDRRSKEFDSTMVDLKILSNLALFHSRRIPAAVSYRLYSKTGDVAALDEAIKYERSAIEAWRQLVAAAGDYYTDNMLMGAPNRGLDGHWKDELVALEKGLAALEQTRSRAPAAAPGAKPAPHYQAAAAKADGPVVTHRAVTTAPAGKPLTITAQVHAPSGVKWVRLRYRIVNQTVNYETLEMKAIDDQGHYQATVPGEKIDPAWDFMYLIEAMDNQKNGTIYPDFNKETPYIIVRLTR